MTDTNLPASLVRRLASAEAEIANLYRIRSHGEDPRDDREVVFSLAGELFASTSPRFYFSPAGVVRSALVSVTSLTSNVVVLFTKNGGSIGSAVIVPGGTNWARVVFGTGSKFSADADYLQVGVSFPGGGSNLTVQVRYTVTRQWPTVVKR